MKAFLIPLFLTVLALPYLSQAQDPFAPRTEKQEKEASERAAFIGCNGSAELKVLRGKPIKILQIVACDDLKDLSPVAGLKLEEVMLWKIDVENITPLSGMPIRKLVIFGCPVKDLSVLKGMPLESLWVGATKVSDFSPLKDLPLTDLSLHSSDVSDLTPLEGMPLESLNIQVTDKITDLTPLKGMKLKHLEFDSDKVTRGMEVIRDMKSLQEINRMPADEFWRTYDSQQIERKTKDEQADTGQAVTVPDSKSAGGDKPQPEAEESSR